MVDLRTKRAKVMIEAAFIELAQQKKFQSISVTDIASTAMVNRQTFYAHYQDKNQLVETMITDFLVEFAASLQQYRQLVLTQHSLTEAQAFWWPQVGQLFLDARSKLQVLRPLRVGTLTLDNGLQQVFVQNFTSFFEQISQLEKMMILSVIQGLLTYILTEDQFPAILELEQVFIDLLASFTK